jgi:hypothetical protein
MAVQITPAMQNQIAQNYLALLGRNPDPTGFSFRSTYSARTTSSAVSLLYQNVLLRAPDSSGLTYWTNYANTLIANGQTISNAYAQTAAQIIYTASSNGSSDSAGINSRTTAAVTQGTSAPIVTTTLTTNVDNLNVGPNALVIGTVGTTAATTTLQAGDSITGNGLNNMLRVVDTSGLVANGLAGVTLTGVQTLQVQNTVGGNVAGSIYNLANASGVTTVQSTNAVANSGTGFTNLAAGTVVSVSGSASGPAFTSFAYANTTSAVIINLNGGITTAQVINNFSTIAAGAAPTSATITSTGGVNGVASSGAPAASFLNLTKRANDFAGLGAASLTSLTVSATTNLNVALNQSDYAAAGAALTVLGAATNVDLGSTGIYRTIDASGLTAGGLTVNASSPLTSFIGGGGNDSLTNQFGGGAVIRSTATIDAGAGVDTIASTLINSGNGAVFRNFEVLSLDREARGAIDANILTNSVLTGVSFDRNGSGANVTVSNLVENTAGFNVTIGASFNGFNTTLGFTAASISGTADILNYTFSSTDGGGINAGLITHQGIEQVTIASGGIVGTTNFLALSDSALQTITITGARGFSLDGLFTTSNNVQTNFGQGVLSNSLITQLTRIDGSSATGNLSIFDRGSSSALISKAAVTILSGSGNDTIFVLTNDAGTAAGAPVSFGGDTVTTGAGTDMVVVIDAPTRSATDPAFTTITDLARGDLIQFFGGGPPFNRSAVNVSAATSLVGALNIALAANLAMNSVSYFVFGANTFMVENIAAAPTIQTNDIVVRLTGVVDLSTGSINTNNGMFTLI